MVGETEPGFATAETGATPGALRDAVVDAASVGAGLWLSYLFALFYFAIAAGAVTHRDLFLESPVKLPFLNIDLPLKAFFILGPLVFLIVHAYVLLHFVLLADKIGAFHTALRAQISGDEDAQARLLRQLPSNIFVQFLSGPPEVRHGIVGFLLKIVVWISLIAGPIALLILFQLQFLPYHSHWITIWQRFIVVIDLVLLWILWPRIARGEAAGLWWCDFKRASVLTWLVVSFLPVLLVVTIATFPDEWLEENLPPVRLIPTTWEAWTLPSVEAIEAPGSGWVTLHELSVGRRQSPWPNVLVLPYFEVGDRAKVDTEGKIAISANTISLSGRSLERAFLVFADLRKANFAGASLAGADFGGADLREAKFNCGVVESIQRKCTQLQGANLFGAQLQGADLLGAQLQGTRLGTARLQGAYLNEAQLQGADLHLAQLQGAYLNKAQLQGANLHLAQLEGASLDDAQLQGANLRQAQLQGVSLSHVFVWKTTLPSDVTGALVDAPEPGPKYSGLGCPSGECDWSETHYAELKSLIENWVPAGHRRDEALQRIKVLENPPYVADEGSAKAWMDLASARPPFDTLAKVFKEIGCTADGASYVIATLTPLLDARFAGHPSQEVEVAAAFLKGAKCPGARGLSEENRAKLQEIHDGSPPASPGPGTAAR